MRCARSPKFSAARVSLTILVGWLLVSACQPYQPVPDRIPFHFQDWKLADLRLLQNPPEEVPAELALVALYTRELAADIQIRVDFLASRPEPDCDLYLFFDAQPGGGGGKPLLAVKDQIQWDFAIILPAGGPGLVFRPDGSTIPALIPRYSRDSLIGDLVLTLRKEQFPGNPRHYQVVVFSTSPGSKLPAGNIGPAWNDTTPPRPAPVLLAFWNTLPAATPAQTLRRWDGAHTGPLGQRHGLKELIDASASNNVPVGLLDLKKPASLQALDYLGVIPWIQDLTASGLLLLPDTAWGDPYLLRGLYSSRDSAARFGIKPSAFLYGALRSALPEEYRFVFARLQDSSHLARRGNHIFVPLPANNGAEFDLEHPETGLTIAARRQTIAVALSPDPSDLLALGGSLPESLWGDSITAAQAMGYLGGHPWIQMLDESGLETLPPAANGSHPLCPDWACLIPAENDAQDPAVAVLRQELEAMPQSAIHDLAWDTYLRLTDPDPDSKRMALNREYLPEIRELVRAASWANDPVNLSTCTFEAGVFGKPGCMLANQNLFLIIDPEKALIQYAFGLIHNKPVQMIGPSSQLDVGLGDPAEWQPGKGFFSDPQVIPGAFWDQTTSTGSFRVEIHSGEMVFSRAEPHLTKLIHLEGSHLIVSFETQSPVQTTLPLLVNSLQGGIQDRFGSYAFEPTDGGWRWGISQGPTVEVWTNGSGEFTSFLESRSLMANPENPDRDYPAGHYLPFPLAVIHISVEKYFTVSMAIQ
ncbi:MAG TPA: hypothetical protein VMT46_18060 [Anaerolineaceae bacterium]|nr:hypothetical protein [Anaerolineaceae bacterium]